MSSVDGATLIAIERAIHPGESVESRLDRIEKALAAVSDAVPAARESLAEVTTAATASGVVQPK